MLPVPTDVADTEARFAPSMITTSAGSTRRFSLVLECVWKSYTGMSTGLPACAWKVQLLVGSCKQG